MTVRGRATVILFVAAALAGPAVRAAGQGLSERSARELVDALRAIRSELNDQREFSEIRRVREAQKQFLRSNAKFPDFIEVGIDVWLAAYDWHIKWQQPAAVGRDAANRYTLTMLGTTLIMRTDAEAGYVGLPYDTR
jgi:hypothetical protein